MAEKINFNAEEQSSGHEEHDVISHEVKKPEHEHHSNHTELEHSQRQAEQQARQAAEKISKPSAEMSIDANSDNKQHQGNTKGETYKGYGEQQTLKRIQKHLKPSERRFSKVIHNPIIEATSDLAGATIARPSGMLYGGIFSLISSLVLYLVSKHYGYEYPYFVGVLFFIGGFIFGLLVESTIKIFKKNNN